jgi:alpha-1,2-mannosyltransferase
MAQVMRTRSLLGPRLALQQIGALLGLGLLPAALAVLVIGGAIGQQFAFDFHGVVWQSARDVAQGHDPYPPPTAAGVAPGNPFVYPPAIAFVFIPLGLLPYPLAAALITVVLLAAVAATLRVLDVRDWRCYGAAYLSIPVLHDVRLGALTPLLALGVALAWRWRERTAAAIPVAFVIVAKLFLWPLGVWLLATGRMRVALRSALYGVAATALAWLAIGFAGLADYPRLLRVLSDAYQGRGYSPVAGGLALGLGSTAAHALAIGVGLVALGLCVVAGRRGDDAGSLALALAASLLLTPIVWLHYFVLLLVPIAIARRTFSPIWLMPALFWITPYEESFGAHWRIAAGLGLSALILAVARAENARAPVGA